MTNPLQALKGFDVDASDATVWAFKKSGGGGETPPNFSGRWIQTTADLDGALKTTFKTTRDGIAEVREFGLLAQNNEGSALAISLDETHAPSVLAQIGDPDSNRKVKSFKEINNTAFYVVNFMCDEHLIYAVKKTDSSWRSMKSITVTSAIFADNILTLDTRPRFTLSNSFDFFIVGNEILVLDKAGFESILNYKQAHINDFATLQGEPEFLSVFSGISDLVEFIGNNKIHLRRASAIKAKGHYRDKDFMDRLRAEAAHLGFAITFDSLGRIVPTPDSCRDILQALLDHRLDSRLSKKVYDVDSTADVTLH